MPRRGSKAAAGGGGNAVDEEGRGQATEEEAPPPPPVPASDEALIIVQFVEADVTFALVAKLGDSVHDAVARCAIEGKSRIAKACGLDANEIIMLPPVGMEGRTVRQWAKISLPLPTLTMSTTKTNGLLGILAQKEAQKEELVTKYEAYCDLVTQQLHDAEVVAKKELEGLRDEVSTKSTQLSRKTNDFDNLQGQFQQLLVRMDGLVTDSTTQKQEMKAVTHQVRVLTEQNQALGHQVQVLTDQNQALGHQVTKQNQELKPLRDQVQVLTEQNQELKPLRDQVQVLTEQNQELKPLRDQVQVLTQQNQALGRQVRVVTQQNQELTRKVEDLGAQLVKMGDRVKELEIVIAGVDEQFTE